MDKKAKLVSLTHEANFKEIEVTAVGEKGIIHLTAKKRFFFVARKGKDQKTVEIECTPKRNKMFIKNEKKEVRRALQTTRRRIGLFVLILALSSLRAGTHYRNFYGLN